MLNVALTLVAILAVALLLLYEVLGTMLGFCCWCCTGGEGGRRSLGAGEQRTATASLLAADKEEEASLGSSYDSVSHDGDHDEELGGDEEERRLCVVCCDARRDCFFLPCGHSATCHPCGTRYLQCVFAEQDCMVERLMPALSQDCGGRWWQLPILPEEAQESEEDFHPLIEYLI
jgi:hypothetical protein